jgi:glycosyltransferase involved in cell wall biosynthesis
VTGRRSTLAFVPPRYGTEVVGGSESVMREAAHGLAERGWDVEVLTTCASSHYTWANDHPPGETRVGPVKVHRFPTVLPVTGDLRHTLEVRMQAGLALTHQEELTWLNGVFRVPELFHHLLAHGSRYRAIVLSPYLFWSSVACAGIAPERTVMMPCLHDEAYARLEVVRTALTGAARAWFLSGPEHDLAHRLGLAPAAHDVVGAGVEVPPAYDPEGFRARHGLGRPFVLYAGRREGGKGWDELLSAFAEASGAIDLDLVTMGVGRVEVPPGLEGRVVDLGFLPDEEAPHAFAAAAAYVQPSRNESFSRTVMEAWLAGTPVLANAQSEVVRWHCERSGAGVTWEGRDELIAGLELVSESSGAAAAIARQGRAYVLEHYTWPAVLDRMEASLEALPCAG